MEQPMFRSLEKLVDSLGKYDKRKPTTELTESLVNEADEDYRSIIETIPREKRRDMDAIDHILKNSKKKQFMSAKARVDKAKEEFDYLKGQVKYYTKQYPVTNHSPQTRDGQTVSTSTLRQTSRDGDYGQMPAVYDATEHQMSQNADSRYKTDVYGKQTDGRTNDVYQTSGGQTGSTQHIQHSDGGARPVQANVHRPHRQNNKKANVMLRRNNPEIADLSDENRPTKIAERYSELYDNEWTDAFDALTSHEGKSEEQAIDILRGILEHAYEFNKEEAERLIIETGSGLLQVIRDGYYDAHNDQTPDPEISEDNRYFIVQLRKERSTEVLPRIKKDFKETKWYREAAIIKRSNTNKALTTYTDLAVELTWWMHVQDPPVHMHLPHDQDFDTTLYRAFMKSGKTVEFYVWPALFLYQPKEGRGPIMAKGVAQGR